MKSAKTALILIAIMSVSVAVGWSQSAPAQALDNVFIHQADGNTIKNGTIVWRDGIIESVGRNADIPFDAFVIDGGDSLHVYPGFLDGLALWGSPSGREEDSCLRGTGIFFDNNGMEFLSGAK